MSKRDDDEAEASIRMYRDMPVQPSAYNGFDQIKQLMDLGVPTDEIMCMPIYKHFLETINMPVVTPQHNHGILSAGNHVHGHAGAAPQRMLGQKINIGAAQQASAPYMPDKQELMHVLSARLRVPQGAMFPLDFIDFHVAKDKVYVFAVTPTGATIIEDNPDLFPSDALITA